MIRHGGCILTLSGQHVVHVYGIRDGLPGPIVESPTCATHEQAADALQEALARLPYEGLNAAASDWFATGGCALNDAAHSVARAAAALTTAVEVSCRGIETRRSTEIRNALDFLALQIESARREVEALAASGDFLDRSFAEARELAA